MLEMGQPVKLQDLARHLIRLSGFVPDHEIQISFTGLRPGEKLSEELVGPDERIMPSSSKEILRVCPNQVPHHDWLAVGISHLERVAHLQNEEEVLANMSLLVPSFQYSSRVPTFAVEHKRISFAA